MYIKMFELFDSDNNYKYKLVNTSDEVEDGMKSKLHLYTFSGKDIKYYVRVSLFDVSENEDYNKIMDNFISLDFLEEDAYEKDKDQSFGITYTNTNKFDAYKVLNTVFDILKESKLKLDTWVIAFNCTKDRYKIYLYIVHKMFDDILLVQEKDDMYNFYLYSRKYYHENEDGSIIRNDNSEIIYLNSHH